MSYIFVEIEDVLATPKNGAIGSFDAIKNYKPRSEVIETINALSEKFEIITFTATSEEFRTSIEDFLIENNVQTDTILMRDEYNKKAGHFAREKIISDFFNGNENKRFVDTHSVYTNHEKFAEMLLDEEYTVFQVG